MSNWLDVVGERCRRIGWPVVMLIALTVGIIVGMLIGLAG